MHMNTQRPQRGFSLVEVFVALLILSVGLIALAKLQVDLVRGSADARARTVALSLAEEKIEDLRTFAETGDGTGTWSVTANPMKWTYISGPAIGDPPCPPPSTPSTTPCTGGRIGPQTTYSSALEVAGVRFLRTWEVGNPGDPGFPLHNFTGTGPITSHTKDVRVTVSWQNEAGATQSVNVLANIVEIPPGNVVMASQPVSAPPSGPATLYNPGVAPEVVAIPLNNNSGGKRESTKPLPDIQAHGGYSNLVSFDTVNYHYLSNLSQFVLDRKESFRTVNCRCALVAGPGLGRTPARVAFVNGKLVDQPGASINNKPWTGVTLTSGNNGISQQPPECDICCRDHHDGPATTVNGVTDTNRFNPTATSDQAVYLNNANGTFTQASNTGDAYDDACRLKIVNGLEQVFQDWQLQVVTVMPKSDLVNTDGSNGPKFSAYQTAVQNFVMGVASAQAGVGTAPTNLSAWFTPSAVSVNPATPQLLARAIYIDYMPPNLLTAINGILTDGDPTNDASIMSMIPFYEVHMTKLADWSTYPDLKNALVSSAAIVTDPAGNVGQLYSRGFVQPAATPPGGTPTILASIKAHNTGFTDTAAVSPSYEVPHPTTAVTVGNGNNATNYYYTATNPATETAPATSQHKDGTLAVTVAANTKTITISITLNQAKGSATINGSAISASIGGVACSSGSATGQGIETFTCTVTADPTTGQWSGTVNFSSSSGYAFCLNNDAVKSGNTYTTMCTALSGGNLPLGPLTGNYNATIYVSTVF